MEFFESLAHSFLTAYGWEGTALAGVLLTLLGVQLYYYIFVYGRIPGYKNNRRPEILHADPPVSVILPLF
ncbi:MAG: glycosyltransferase, partial [Alistipes sp.]|nr:glycosyltransferase [Alistipes sp.]